MKFPTLKPWQYGLVAAAAVLLLVGYCAPAHASDFYGKANVGFSTNTEANDFNLSDGSTYGVAVGTAVSLFRVEASVDRITADTGPLNIHAVAFGATAYLDHPITAETGVFAGLGYDYYMAEAGFGPFSADQTGHGPHGTIGVAHRVTDHSIVEAAVTYRSADFDTFDANSTAFTVGYRFRL